MAIMEFEIPTVKSHACGALILPRCHSAPDETYASFGTNAASADRKSTRLNSSHLVISYAVFCLKKKKRASINSSSCAEVRRSPPLRSTFLPVTATTDITAALRLCVGGALGDSVVVRSCVRFSHA